MNNTTGISFRIIPETRFKTSVITLTLVCPLSSDTAAANSLLPHLLSRACSKYPDITALKRKLASLYGAVLSGDVISIGDAQLLRFTVRSIDDRYTMDGEKISVECAQLLSDILTSPPLADGLFRSDFIESEKRLQCEKIDAQINDKVSYSTRRCIELMCENEPFGVNPLGDKESVGALNAENMTELWTRVLRTYPVHLTAVGSMDGDAVKRAFTEAFSSVERASCKLPSHIFIEKADKVREFTDYEDVTQSKLVLGFRTPFNCTNDPYIMRLVSACFGGTAHSRLFVNVREKMSLCYYCSSSYFSSKGILLVRSGLESENIEKAKTEILAQLADIQNGGLTDEEIANAKMSLRNSFLESLDSPRATELWYTSQMFDSTVLSVEEACAKIDSYTKEDVTNAARAISLDTVYLLTKRGEQ